MRCGPRGAMHFDLRAHTALLTLAGSRAYGIHRPDSDVDLKGVAVPPARVLHGFAQRFEQADTPALMGTFLPDLTEEERRVAASTKVEGSVYALAKLVRLAAQCNPNILDVLFCRDADIRLITPIGERLRAHRHLFLTARARHTFAGYAAAQLKRIQLHWRWHHQGPERQPTRAEYSLPERTLIPANQLAAAQAAVRKQVDGWSLDLGEVDEAAREAVLQRVSQVVAELGAGLGLDEAGARWLAAARWVGLDDNFIELMQREREYGAARDEWRRYQTWKTRRNPERAALEARFGYDVKHGAHLVRLLRMGREILETGQVFVWRGPGGADDADELLAIRGGAWSYAQLLEWVEAQEATLSELYDAGEYAVPHRPDVEAIDRLCVELTESALG